MNRFWTHHTLIACFDFPNGLQIHWTDRTPVYSISFWVCDVARRSRSLRVRCATLCQKNWSNTNGTRNKSDKHFETMPSKSLFYHQLQWCCYPHSCKIMTWTVKLTNCERETTQWNLHQHVFFCKSHFNPTSSLHPDLPWSALPLLRSCLPMIRLWWRPLWWWMSRVAQGSAGRLEANSHSHGPTCGFGFQGCPVCSISVYCVLIINPY